MEVGIVYHTLYNRNGMDNVNIGVSVRKFVYLKFGITQKSMS